MIHVKCNNFLFQFFQGRLEIKTLICATHGGRPTWWFIFLLRIFATLETAIQVKNFFLLKTQIPYLNKLIIFSLRFFGFFCHKIGQILAFLRTILSIGSNFTHRISWIWKFEIQSVNVMNEYYVCFFVKEQKKRKIKEMNKSTKKKWKCF